MLDDPLTVFTPFNVLISQNNLPSHIWDKFSPLLNEKTFSFPCYLFQPLLKDTMSVIVSCIGTAMVKCEEEDFHGNDEHKICIYMYINCVCKMNEIIWTE